MLSNETKLLGAWGELAASRVLLASGYQVLGQNYRTFAGEADIVCRQGDILVFVEVKTRRSARFGGGEEAVSRNKLLKLAKCALSYTSGGADDASDWRIDVVVIEAVARHCYQLKHYQNVLPDGDEKLLDDS